jgi:hypothetical protein
MLSRQATLSLSRTLADPDEVVLVPSTVWSRERAESQYGEIEARSALGILENLDRHRWTDVRRFAAELGRCDIHRLDDQEVLSLVRDAIRDGRAIAVQKGAGKPAGASAATELRRLVAQVEKATRGKLSHRGRNYRLVVDVELARLPGREYYEVACEADAHAVLDGIAQESPASAAPLRKACEKLSKDWRPPLQPDGLVLLRRVPVQASAPKDEGPALTPSQMKALLRENRKEEIVDWAIWIEVDPDDPKAQDDTVILLDASHEEVERKVLAGCPRQGSGVIAIFKDIEKHSRYTLVRDYGPDEGGGADTLFIDRSPADLEEELSKSA